MGLDLILSSVFSIIDKVVPDKAQAAQMKLKTMELQQAGEFKALEHEEKLAQAQTDVNKVEAASDSLFVAGWRPFIGWISGVALATNYLFVPLATWLGPAVGLPTPPGRLDMGELMYLLGGMLGFGGLRTYEKLKGVSGK